jgi:heme O synthase-like polyprenyltransferase
MNSWTVLEWVVFALCAVWTISTNIALRQHYKNSDQPMLPANSTAMTQLIGVVVIAVARIFSLSSPLDTSHCVPHWLHRATVQIIRLHRVALRICHRLHGPIQLVI